MSTTNPVIQRQADQQNVERLYGRRDATDFNHEISRATREDLMVLRDRLKSGQTEAADEEGLTPVGRASRAITIELEKRGGRIVESEAENNGSLDYLKDDEQARK